VHDEKLGGLCSAHSDRLSLHGMWAIEGKCYT